MRNAANFRTTGSFRVGGKKNRKLAGDRGTGNAAEIMSRGIGLGSF